MVVQRLNGGITQAALRLVDDAFEGKIIIALRDDA